MSSGSRFRIALTNAFKKDVKAAKRRGKNLDALFAVISQLAAGAALPHRNREHALSGNWRGTRECHIEPDWLLIYEKDAETLVLICVRTGTHSDLF